MTAAELAFVSIMYMSELALLSHQQAEATRGHCVLHLLQSAKWPLSAGILHNRRCDSSLFEQPDYKAYVCGQVSERSQQRGWQILLLH